MHLGCKLRPVSATTAIAATAVVAANVRSELNRLGKTQCELATALKLSQTAVSRRLRGLTPFDVDELATTAELLGVSASSLLGEVAAA